MDKSSIGQPDGVAGLNNEGYVPLGQLPPVYRDIAVEFDKKVDKESIGQPDGVAGLDDDGKVPMAQLPEIIGEIPDKVDKSVIGKAGGVAGLDATGKVPAANLPSYVDDVINAYVRPEGTLYGADWLSLTEGGEALTPESGKVYIVVKGEYVNREYRWSGELYAQIKGDIVIGEVTGTAYDGGKGKKTTDDLAALTAQYNAYIQKKITESQLDSRLTAKVNNNAKTNANNTFYGGNTFCSDIFFANDGFSTLFYGDVQFNGKVTGVDEIAISTVEPTNENTKEWIKPDEDIIVTTLTLTGETGDDPDKVMHQQGVTAALSEVAATAKSQSDAASAKATAAQTTANSGVTKAESAQANINKIINGETVVKLAEHLTPKTEWEEHTPNTDNYTCTLEDGAIYMVLVKIDYYTSTETWYQHVVTAVPDGVETEDWKGTSYYSELKIKGNTITACYSTSYLSGNPLTAATYKIKRIN